MRLQAYCMQQQNLAARRQPRRCTAGMHSNSRCTEVTAVACQQVQQPCRPGSCCCPMPCPACTAYIVCIHVFFISYAYTHSPADMYAYTRSPADMLLRATCSSAASHDAAETAADDDGEQTCTAGTHMVQLHLQDTKTSHVARARCIMHTSVRHMPA